MSTHLVTTTSIYSKQQKISPRFGGGFSFSWLSPHLLLFKHQTLLAQPGMNSMFKQCWWRRWWWVWHSQPQSANDMRLNSKVDWYGKIGFINHEVDKTNKR
jgi:hypothetical protein